MPDESRWLFTPRSTILVAFRCNADFEFDHQVQNAYASLSLPKGYLNADDIRLNFGLGGGATMDCGTYCLWALRKIFGTEPGRCVMAIPRKPGFPGFEGSEVEEAMKARLTFPNGGIGTIYADLRRTGGYRFSWLTGSLGSIWTPVARVKERTKIIEDDDLREEGKEHAVVREVIFWNMVFPSFWHRIDVIEDHTIIMKQGGKLVKQWQKKEVVKDYGPQGKESWTTYRWQLEAFVDRIKGRDTVGVWIEGDDSIKQMKAIDMVYEKAGLSVRPSSVYFKASADR